MNCVPSLSVIKLHALTGKTPAIGLLRTVLRCRRMHTKLWVCDKVSSSAFCFLSIQWISKLLALHYTKMIWRNSIMFRNIKVNFGVNREANYIDGFRDIELTSSADWYANIKMVAVLYTILYSDVIMRQRLKSLGSRLFPQRLFRCRSKKT